MRKDNKRVIKKNGATLKDINRRDGYIILRCEKEKIQEIKKQLAERGFDEKSEKNQQRRGELKKVFSYIKSVVNGEEDFVVETKLVEYATGSLILLIFLFGLVHATILKNFDYSFKYLPLVFLSLITAVTATFSYYHIRCYKKDISCSTGMMAGMASGMIIGFMAGEILGATNGMFVGSVAGVVFGVILGFTLGKMCGIMGAMEGLMAGLMSGIMGAMTSVMMLNDNLVAFLYFSFGICLVVMGGLSYMMYREIGFSEKNELKTNFIEFAIVCILISSVIVGLMFYGPKRPLVY